MVTSPSGLHVLHAMGAWLLLAGANACVWASVPASTEAGAGAPGGPSATPVQWVGRFDTGLSPWTQVVVDPKLASNRFAARVWDGVPAVEVVSDASMSLLARAVDVDLERTPVLCWAWRIDRVLSTADLTTRAGDDYAARLYVALRIPPQRQSLALRTKLRLARAVWGDAIPDASLNYVWDNRHPVGTEVANAYTDRAMMIVKRSGAADAGSWVWERQHVGRDVRRVWGEDARLVQIAITADTDNTRESARSGFAQLHFVAEDAPCRR